MGNKRTLALRKQLKREQRHVVWLEQHLPQSRQLNTAQRRIAQLCVLECRYLRCNLANTQCHNKKERRRSAALSLTEVGFA